ncbi:MAG: helicase-related protein, partial [Candidatus Micrarchaeaceae archaeon]
MLLVTGSLSGGKRAALEAEAKAISATPQTISNDLKHARLSLDDVGVVVFDECHRAVGRYAYTYIANECKLKGVQLVGLTASPGSNKKRIDELIDTLGINNIEIRISSDLDVEPYVMGKDIHTHYVEKGRLIDSILANLKPVIDEHLTNLYKHGLSPFKNFENMPKGRFLQIGDNISKLEAKNYKFMAIFNYVYVLNLVHAYDLLSTEGLHPFAAYMHTLETREKKSRAVNSILSNKSVISAMKMARDAIERGEEHPKMITVINLLKKELLGKSVIIFAQYRSTIKRLEELLNLNGIEARAFVGKKDGVTQHQQQETIQQFREGRFRVLVATSIG